MINFDNIKEKIFYKDGSLRDIYLFPISAEDWEKLYNYLINRYPIEFRIDGKIITNIPKTSQAVFNLRETQAPSLSVLLGGIRVNVHFFSNEEFEGDISPKEINNQNDLDKLLDFMRSIGNLLGKDVILTSENMKNDILLIYKISINKYIV